MKQPKADFNSLITLGDRFFFFSKAENLAIKKKWEVVLTQGKPNNWTHKEICHSFMYEPIATDIHIVILILK